MHTWRKMRQYLCEQFLPLDQEQVLYCMYQECQQWQRLVNEYTEKFYQLTIYMKQLVSHYINGLREQIMDELSLHIV